LARNKSERFPSCPALHAYAKRCLEVLDDPEHSGGSGSNTPWFRVDMAVRHECLTAFRKASSPSSGQVEYVRRWRKFIIAYAKENYGP